MGESGNKISLMDGLRAARNPPGKAPCAHAAGESVRHEAQALAAVQHPCLATVYAFGVEGGLEYMVMERIYGSPLDDHLARVQPGDSLWTCDSTQDLA